MAKDGSNNECFAGRQTFPPTGKSIGLLWRDMYALDLLSFGTLQNDNSRLIPHDMLSQNHLSDSPRQLQAIN